jgi:hypothetical protein
MPQLCPHCGQAVKMRIWTLLDDKSLDLQCFLLVEQTSVDLRAMVPQRGLLGAARLALRVGLRPIKLAAPICRTVFLSVRGSNEVASSNWLPIGPVWTLGIWCRKEDSNP